MKALAELKSWRIFEDYSPKSPAWCRNELWIHFTFRFKLNETEKLWMSPPLAELWPRNASQLSLATDLNLNEMQA